MSPNFYVSNLRFLGPPHPRTVIQRIIFLVIRGSATSVDLEINVPWLCPQLPIKGSVLNRFGNMVLETF